MKFKIKIHRESVPSAAPPADFYIDDGNWSSCLSKHPVTRKYADPLQGLLCVNQSSNSREPRSQIRSTPAILIGLWHPSWEN